MRRTRRQFIAFIRNDVGNLDDPVEQLLAERHVAAVEVMTEEQFQAHEDEMYVVFKTRGPREEMKRRLGVIVDAAIDRYVGRVQ